MPTKTAFFILLILFTKNIFAQNVPDSVDKAIFSIKDNRKKIELYLEAGIRQMNENSNKSIDYLQKSYKIAAIMDSINNTEYNDVTEYKSLMAKCLRKIGLVYHRLGSFNEATESLQKSLVLYVEIGDKKEIAESMVTIGNTQISQGNTQQALKYFEKALGLQEEMIAETPKSIDIKKGMASSLINIAKVSLLLNNYDIVNKYIAKALNIYTAINDVKGAADCNYNLSGLYYAQNDFENALLSIHNALVTYQKLDDNIGISNSYNQIGKILTSKSDYVNAIKNFLKAKQIYESIGDVQDGLKCLNNIAELYNKLGFYQLSTEYSFKSLPIAQKLNAKYDIKNTYNNFSTSYAGMGNHRLALEYHIKFYEISEKLFSEESSRQLQELEVRYQIEQQQQKIELLEIQRDKKNAESKVLNIILTTFICGFILLLIFAIFIYNSYHHKKKANMLLAEQKIEILKKNHELLQQKEEITLHRNEIENQRDELRNLNATKDKFFSIIAHDLKNPFVTLLGFSDLLITGFDTITDKKKMEFLHMINKAGKETYELLENLLQWSRSQRGQIEFLPVKTDLLRHINENIDLLQYTANKKEIKITVNSETNIQVIIDDKMLNTIIRNLISNAIKFSNIGSEIKVSVIKKENFAEINIIDNGIGIKGADLQKLFRIDIHHSTIGTNEESGTGLGLILCKEFAEKMGGKIYVQSTYGKGSIFSFTVQLA